MSDFFTVLILFSLPFVLYGFFQFFKWGLRRRKWELANKWIISESDRLFLMNKFHPYQFLAPEEKVRLENKIRYFLANKRIEGIGGLALTENMKLLIAAHACLLMINFELPELYPGLTNVFVTPSGYIEKDNPVNPYLGRPIHVPKLGESWKRGPIILSWQAIEQSTHFRKQKQNLIYHEFSHQLDQQDGHFDGTPELATQNQYQLWASVMSREFLKLRHLVNHQRKSDIDSYGATNEAEFFAVCTEYFFTDPVNLQSKHPEIFKLFKSFFKIDPLKWH